MFCTKCGSEKNSEQEMCQNCELQAQEKISAPKTPKQKLKSFLISAVSIVVFLLAFGAMKVLTEEGTSFLAEKKSTKETQEKVVNYFTDTSSWKEFNSTLGGFKASFPVYPTHETTQLEIPGVLEPVDMETYGAEEPDSTTNYAIAFTSYPSSVELASNPLENLENSVNGNVQGTGGTLISSNFSNFGAYKAINYVIHISDKDIYYKGRNILVDNTIYQIIAVYESRNSSYVQFDRFVNSFQLL